MPSNPNIALSVKAPQFRSPLETAARAQQIASNAMAMRKAEMETGSVNALREYIKGGGKLDTPEAVTAAISAGASPDTVRMLAQQNIEVGKVGMDRKKAAAERLFNRLGAVDRAGEMGNDQPWSDWLNDYASLGEEEAREAQAYLRITGGKYDAPVVKSLMAGALEYFKKTTPQAQAEVVQDVAGDFYEARTGGLGAPSAVSLDVFEPQPKTGTVEMGEQTTVEPGVGGPDGSSPAQQLMLNLASVRDDAGYQTILSALDRADPQIAQQLRAVAPRFDPAVLSRVVKDANAALGGGAAPAADSLVAGERGGVGGPLEGYVSTGRQLRGKSPMQSPLPGSAQVPISRVAAEKRVEAQATKDVELAAEQAKKIPGKKQVSTILGKMRNAYEQLEKAEAIPSEKRGGFANALDYLGSSALGREAQKFVGTKESKYLSQIVNLRKALATAIKNATGMTAQEMNSNVELQLTLDTLSDPTQGIESARQTLADLEELYGMPKKAAPAQRRTPTQKRSNIDALLEKYGD